MTRSYNSPPNVRKGAQEPRIKVEPLGIPYTDAQDAKELLAFNGMELFPWQMIPLNAWLARAESDELLYTTCILDVPRQNGKNVVVEAREYYELLACGGHILHTAHRVKTAKKSFRRLVRYFTDEKNNPGAAAKVENIRYTNGEEAIYLTNGGYIEYVSRGRGTSRGFDDITLVVFDEAQELTDEQVEAIMYTLAASASGDRQIIYTGTPPSPTAPGETFTRVRNNAIKNPTDSTCLHEWSVEEIGDVTDRNRWYAANPSLGYTLSEEFTETELSNSAPDGFARERLGWWSDQAANAAIPSDTWDKAAIERDLIPTQGKRAFGVKFAVDGSYVALCGCLLTEEGTAHVEAVHQAPIDEGIRWLADFLCEEERAEKTAAIALDGKNGMDALLDYLREEYPRQALFIAGTKGMIASANMFLEALKDNKITHWKSEEQKALDVSAKTSIKRPIGNDGGWGFGGENSPLIEAAALAFWAAKTTKRDPDGGCEIF